MEQQKGHMCEGSMGGSCGSACSTMSGAMHCHKNWIFRKLFVLIAMLFMFWLGLRLGELRTLSSMMMQREHGEFNSAMMYHSMDTQAMMMPAVSVTATAAAEKTK